MTKRSASTVSADFRADDELFGRPKWLIFLFATEIGLGELTEALEVLSGPLDAQPFASQI